VDGEEATSCAAVRVVRVFGVNNKRSWLRKCGLEVALDGAKISTDPSPHIAFRPVPRLYFLLSSKIIKRSRGMTKFLFKLHLPHQC